MAEYVCCHFDLQILCIVAIFACIWHQPEDDDEDRWDDEEEFALEYIGNDDGNIVALHISVISVISAVILCIIHITPTNIITIL